MKDQLRNVFAPILNRFEKGSEPYKYDSTHRKITIAVGALFIVLAGVSVYLTVITAGFGALIPFLAFGGVGCVSLIVGVLGNDRAIAKIWGTK